MEFVGFGLAVVAIGIAAWLWQRSTAQSREASARQEKLEKELADSKKQAKSSDQLAKEAVDEAQRLQTELEEALARRDEKAITRALWNLELDRSRRQWAEVIVPGVTDTSDNSKVSTGEQLTFAISQDVERLREEVGVSIRFDGGFDLDVDPEAALAALRITEELLAIAARLSDEVAVSLDQLDSDEEVSELLVTLECVGWDDEEASPEDISQELINTVERLDGSLSWEASDDDATKAILVLPAPTEDFSENSSQEQDPAS